MKFIRYFRFERWTQFETTLNEILTYFILAFDKLVVRWTVFSLIKQFTSIQYGFQIFRLIYHLWWNYVRSSCRLSFWSLPWWLLILMHFLTKYQSSKKRSNLLFLYYFLLEKLLFYSYFSSFYHKIWLNQSR